MKKTRNYKHEEDEELLQGKTKHEEDEEYYMIHTVFWGDVKQRGRV